MNYTETMDVSGVAATVRDAVHTRHSVRHYLEREIPSEELRELFRDSLRAPSWKNSQPWKIHVVTGAKLRSMAEILTSAAQAGPPVPDIEWLEKYPAHAKKRMFDLGMKIYGAAGIDRKDKEARDAFMLRNFGFFQAPAAAFITTTFAPNFYVALDLGCLLNTIMLLAREKGLGTCPQAALSAYPDLTRRELGLPEEEKVVCGISLGYPDPASNLNAYHTPRENEEDLVSYHST